MSADKLISVLMPCYNAAKYLHEAVDSILKQTYSNFELLLIDDGSSDNTWQIISDYAGNDDRVVALRNERNLGLIKTLNRGIDEAKGDFIARMDADDISALNRLEILSKAFDSNPNLDVLSAGFHYLSPGGTVLQRIYPKALDSDALKFVSFFCTPVNHPCVMVKADVFRKNKYDEQFIHSEDYEIFSRLLLNDFQIGNLSSPLYFLRKNTESVSYKFEKIQISTHTKISARNIEMYFHRQIDFFIHKIAINRISFNVSPSMLKEALATLEDLKNEYVRREKISLTALAQIDDFVTEQKIDIYFQSFKYAHYATKIKIFLMALSNFRIFFSKRGIQYIKSKNSFKK